MGYGCSFFTAPMRLIFFRFPLRCTECEGHKVLQPRRRMARTCFIVVGRYVAEPKLKFAMINAGPVMSAQTTRYILFETKAGKVVKLLLINEFLQGEATRFILSLLGLDILLKPTTVVTPPLERLQEYSLSTFFLLFLM